MRGSTSDALFVSPVIPTPSRVIPALSSVIPAKAGIQAAHGPTDTLPGKRGTLDPRFRGDDVGGVMDSGLSYGSRPTMRRLAILAATLPLAACASSGTGPDLAYAPSLPPSPITAPANGAIFNAAAGYAGLAEGNRARHVGDLVTVVLVERTRVSSDAQARTQRGGSAAVTAPGLGEVGRVLNDALNIGADASFSGKGQASQSHTLFGDIAVTIAEVRPGGVVLLRGQKRIDTAPGENWIRLSGLARLADIGPDNRIASVQLADARIEYAGDGAVARSGRPGWLARFFSAVSPF